MQLVHDSHDAVANLYLKPGDRMSKPLKSAIVRTNNILIKITVPKRIGLKRKRKAKGPYHEDLDCEDGLDSQKLAPPPTTIKVSHHLMRTLRDCPNKYHIQPVGSIDYTHRFRGSLLRI